MLEVAEGRWDLNVGQASDDPIIHVVVLKSSGSGYRSHMCNLACILALT